MATVRSAPILAARNTFELLFVELNALSLGKVKQLLSGLAIACLFHQLLGNIVEIHFSSPLSKQANSIYIFYVIRNRYSSTSLAVTLISLMRSTFFFFLTSLGRVRARIDKASRNAKPPKMFMYCKTSLGK